MEEQTKVQSQSRPIPTKPMMSSKTIRVGTVYITIGSLVAILQMFDLLESILATVDFPPDVAAWGGLGLAIIGGIQVWLRTVTTQPVGNTPARTEQGR